MTAHPPHEDQAPGWVLWFFKNGLNAIVGVFLVVVLSIATVTYWFDRRLEHLEEEIVKKPPQSYVAPKLEDYAAPGIPAADIVVDRSAYVPVYSHVYFDGGRPFLLEATLSIRNTSQTSPLYLRSVRYYDTDGKKVKEPVDRVIMLGPLQTIEFLVPRRDFTGGSGANFLVDWFTTDASVQPQIEAVMVGNEGTHGLSFVSDAIQLSTD